MELKNPIYVAILNGNIENPVANFINTPNERNKL